MKRLLTGLAAATLFSLPATAQDTMTLDLVEVITSPQRTETLKSLVKEFEDTHEGVTVEITSLPWGQAFETFATQVSAGETPDVVEMPDRWLALYGGNGKLESLEPYLADWDATGDLNERALEFGRAVDGKTAYEIPYGFYLRALFYNKKLFDEAGVEAPPKTLAEFRTAAEKVSALDGKYGYCMRGGPGGLNGWMMFGATMNGDDTYFKDGKSTAGDPEWIKGYQFLIDLYQDKLAPPDSVNWGFNEIVAGFYSGTCAMLDQDPDALIAIDERMDKADWAVTPMPKGPSGKAFPTIGYAGWSMFADSEHKDMSWQLISFLSSRESNLTWNKRIGALPIYKGMEDDPFYGSGKFKGWFDELADSDVEPTSMPTYLQDFGFFADSLAIRTTQEALLGKKTAGEMGKEWADYLTKAYAKYQDQSQ